MNFFKIMHKIRKSWKTISHMTYETQKFQKIYLPQTWIRVEGNRWGYMDFISDPGTQVVPSTKWFLHKTFTNVISLFINLLTCRSSITAGTTSYDRLSSTPYPSRGIMDVWYPIHFLSMESWNTIWTGANSFGKSN